MSSTLFVLIVSWGLIIFLFIYFSILISAGPNEELNIPDDDVVDLMGEP
jgi:hypothetical protein